MVYDNTYDIKASNGLYKVNETTARLPPLFRSSDDVDLSKLFYFQFPKQYTLFINYKYVI